VARGDDRKLSSSGRHQPVASRHTAYRPSDCRKLIKSVSEFLPLRFIFFDEFGLNLIQKIAT
jgi:hypothetical protein